MSSTLNILIVSTSFPCKKLDTIGGKFVLLEARAYARNGANVKVLTPSFYGAPKYEELEENLEVFRFFYFLPRRFQKIIDPLNPIYHKVNLIWKLINIPFFIICFLYAVFKHSKNSDIVHCQWTPTVLFVLPFRSFRKYKIVTTARGSDLRLFPKWFNRFIMRKVDASINCYGDDWYETLKHYPSNYIKLPLITIDNKFCHIPKDLETIFDNNNESFKIVYLGRFDEPKIKLDGCPIFMLIESVKDLIKIGYKITVVYIGDGALIDQMKEMVIDLKLNNSIYFLGNKQDPENYLPFFDLGLGGSNTDAVTQEMSTVGLPQVSVKYIWGTFSVPWTDRENMFLFNSHDNKSLTETIKFAIDNPDVREKVGKSIQKDIKKFALNYEDGGKKYLQEFKKLLSND